MIPSMQVLVILILLVFELFVLEHTPLQHFFLV